MSDHVNTDSVAVATEDKTLPVVCYVLYLLAFATVFSAFLGTALAGGVLAVIVAIKRGQLQTTMDGSRQLVTAPATGKRVVDGRGRANRFAYGPAIAIGTLAAMLMR